MDDSSPLLLRQNLNLSLNFSSLSLSLPRTHTHAHTHARTRTLQSSNKLILYPILVVISHSVSSSQELEGLKVCVSKETSILMTSFLSFLSFFHRVAFFLQILKFFFFFSYIIIIFVFVPLSFFKPFSTLDFQSVFHSKVL
jgi:hypothetical protein